MCLPGQSFTLWLEGELAAVGGNGCDMNFVGHNLQTPNCSTDMWVAIQGVDSEATSLGGYSKGGIKAAMKWCDQEVATDESWECSTVAERDWQNPVANGFDPRMEIHVLVLNAFISVYLAESHRLRASPGCQVKSSSVHLAAQRILIRLAPVEWR